VSGSQLLYASTRYVKIAEEGDIEELFDDPDGDQGENNCHGQIQKQECYCSMVIL
jgi:hypothetical protein